jgi:5-methyltetrahydrofolate--homocysteine methyltransferase
MPKDVKTIIEGISLFDGAIGAELIARGLGPGESCESWVLDQPDVVSSIHRSYFDAGADVVQTNTLGGTSIKLAHYGLSERMREINTRAAELAKEVCPPDRFVAGNIGTAGRLLEPYGDSTPDELFEAYAEQAEALKEGGVDLIIIETMIDLAEALVALDAAKTVELPVFVTMTFEKKPRGYRTIMGNRPVEAMKRLIDAGAGAVGVNCTLRIRDMIGLVSEISREITFPLIAQPNAGNPEYAEGTFSYIDGPDVFARRLPELISAGARIVGGCCGTSPETIRKMRDVMDSL